MEYYVIATRSRTDAIKLSSELKSRGVRATVVPTPKEAGVGCGLSVKLYPSDYFYAIRAIRNMTKVGFAGMFKISEASGGKVVKRVNLT